MHVVGWPSAAATWRGAATIRRSCAHNSTERRPNVLSVDKQLVVMVVGRKPFADRMGGMAFPVWTRCDYARAIVDGIPAIDEYA